MHKVKCLYCNEIFDADKESFEKIGRRDAHKSCLLNSRNPDEDYIPKIYAFMKQATGGNYDYAVCERQRKSFLKKEMTNEGIFNALVYWFKIKNGSIEKSDGRMGIVPYIYEDAQKYYGDLNRKIKKMENIKLEDKKEKVIDYAEVKKANNKVKKEIDMNIL